MEDKMLCTSPFLYDIQENIYKNCLNQNGVSAEEAYKIVKDQLLPEGNARQNLATFCQTYMEPQAVQLISETLDKNAIDKSLYTQTAEIENRCIDIIAKLWNRPEKEKCSSNEVEVPKGTSTIGSSEACMLGGMSMKFRWKKWAKKYKKTHPEFDVNKKPNLIISSGYQVCWEKFEKYWDVELRTVPIDEAHLSMGADQLTINPEEKGKILIDEYTIGVVLILGITYTGLYDDVEGINSKLLDFNKDEKRKGLFPVQIHIDGASGGFYEPFIDKDYLWDFRLENVISINASGHKYGLVYPGIGWIVWRSSEYLPKELTFEVSYLGGTVRTVGINFSKSASHIIAQYYNFIRYGKEGYEKIHQDTKAVSEYIESKLEQMTIEINGNKINVFEILREKGDRELHRIPLVCWKLSKEVVGWKLTDLSDRLLMRGWQIPAYPLPKSLKKTMIQRIVCRADLSIGLAEILVKDIESAVQILQNKAKANPKLKANFMDSNILDMDIDTELELKPYGFTH